MAKMTKPHNDKLCEDLAVKGTHECSETVHNLFRGELKPEECANTVGTIMISAMKYYAEETQLT